MKLIYGDKELVITNTINMSESEEHKTVYLSVQGFFPDFKSPADGKTIALKLIDDDNSVIFERYINKVDATKCWIPQKSLQASFHYVDNPVS